MQHPNSIALLTYWDTKRGGRPCPARSDIEPADIARYLPHVLIAEAAEDKAWRFRLAGTALCNLAGQELKGPASLGSVAWRLSPQSRQHPAGGGGGRAGRAGTRGSVAVWQGDDGGSAVSAAFRAKRQPRPHARNDLAVRSPLLGGLRCPDGLFDHRLPAIRSRQAQSLSHQPAGSTGIRQRHARHPTADRISAEAAVLPD